MQSGSRDYGGAAGAAPPRPPPPLDPGLAPQRAAADPPVHTHFPPRPIGEPPHLPALYMSRLTTHRRRYSAPDIEGRGVWGRGRDEAKAFSE